MNQTEYEISGVIEKAAPSKSGKNINVRIQGYDRWFLAKDAIIQQQIGQTITGKVGVQIFPDGGSAHWLNEWTVARTAQMPPAAPSPQASKVGLETPKDRAIFVQAVSKSVLSPEMTEEQIRQRIKFLYCLTEEMAMWDLLG